MDKIKMESLFDLDTSYLNGMFTWLVSFDADFSSDSIISSFINDDNKDFLNEDYHISFSAEKYFSPLVVKWLKKLCVQYNVSYESLLNGTLTNAEKITLIVALFDNANGDTFITHSIYIRFAKKWKHIWDALNIEYNPLENYSMYQKRTPNITHEDTFDTTDERTPNVTREDTFNTTDERTPDITSEDTFNTTDERTPNLTTSGDSTNNTETGIFGFNSTSANDSALTDASGTHSASTTGTDTTTKTGTITNTETGTDTTTKTGTITNTETGTDTTTKTGTITNTETGTDELERSGNIGVTTSQQMLQSEFEVRKYDFYKEIYKDIDTILCLKIY